MAETSKGKNVNSEAGQARAGKLDQLPTPLPDGQGVMITEAPKGKNKGGRPTLFSDDVANEICRRVIAGSNLNRICNSGDMPSRDTLYRWLADDQVFSDNYARACKIRREFKYEMLDEIPDQEEDVARARLKVDVIKWQLGKEDSKKYGDRIDIESKSEVTHSYQGMTDEQLDQLIAQRKDRTA